jgi:glutaredoxin
LPRAGAAWRSPHHVAIWYICLRSVATASLSNPKPFFGPVDLYAWATPNSIKVPVLLEELGLAYSIKPINIRQGEQRASNYLKLNPNGKVPVIVDHDGSAGEPITITESAAIMLYIAE